MAKLTRKQTAAVEYALRNLERAKAYIMSKDVAVARRGNFASTTLHYSRADGSTLYEIDREIGSDLCGLDNGINTLKMLLQTQVTSPDLKSPRSYASPEAVKNLKKEIYGV